MISDVSLASSREGGGAVELAHKKAPSREDDARRNKCQRGIDLHATKLIAIVTTCCRGTARSV